MQRLLLLSIVAAAYRPDTDLLDVSKVIDRKIYQHDVTLDLEKVPFFNWVNLSVKFGMVEVSLMEAPSAQGSRKAIAITPKGFKVIRGLLKC